MKVEKCIIKNSNGVSIVKCCASCKHKKLDNRQRLCMAGEGLVPSDYLCPEWEMNPVYEKLGNGDGRIKNPMYLRYALDRTYEDERKALLAQESHKTFTRTPLVIIRREFEELHGSIYMKGE